MNTVVFFVRVTGRRMSILAEPRRKVRLSIDPQNIGWKNDEEKFGKKLMEKMGWSDGKGLGKNLHGNASNLKLDPNMSGRGLGAKACHDSNWIVAHDDFADILASLNKNKPPPAEVEETETEAEERRKKMNMELTSRSIKRRIHYQKFTRAKDLTQYSEKEKAAIFGAKRAGGDEVKAKDDEAKSSDDGEKDEDKKPSSIPLTTSTLSVGDYFAAKMAALQKKRDLASAGIKEEPVDDVEVKQEIKDEGEEEEDEKARRKREKKERKRREREEGAELTVKSEPADEDVEVKIEIKEEPVEEAEDEEESRAQRKRERKERKRLARLAAAEGESEVHADAPKRHYAPDEEETSEEVPAKRRRTEFAPPASYEETEKEEGEEEKQKKKEKKKAKKNKKKSEEEEEEE